MPYIDLRGYLTDLEKAGELIHIKREVDPRWEISAIIRKVGEAAILCERVKGHTIPVVGNLFGNYRKMEMVLEAPRDRLLPEYLDRVRHPLPPKSVRDGPVKEVVWTGDQVDLGRLPIPTINAKDGGPYIDCGILVAKDPEFGTNLSLQRLQLKGRNRLGIFMAPTNHLTTYYQRAEEQGRPLEVAVVIGCDPVLYVVSQITGPPDLDEYTLAGALRRQPVELLPCETVKVEVPATAEIVLEGRILPKVREEEGPFGEFPGYYGDKGNRQVVEITAISHRTDPIFQMLYLGKPPTENVYLTAIPKAADIYRVVREAVAEVRGVYFTPGGCGKYHVVVSIKKRVEGEAKLALNAILSSRIGVKHAVVVDEDIDIYNPHDVEWAIATRSQFDRDSVVVVGVPGVLDPSMVAKRGERLITKVGIDATRPLHAPFPETCDVPPELLRQVREHWDEYLSGS